ncbi:OLC1v1021624C1 [Oldenlandia corymbosa var. corymbosa]|uniref:OLC1v1021624C1 n=1 Tax=Oldenlandia corymbosa var. corymbosa TaxID=529605 RepID=A0AAV1BYC4_OLDCO|nr:OLC1v1021624C1 [Oldenlandia corymbosa var. corymbosa]
MAVQFSVQLLLVKLVDIFPNPSCLEEIRNRNEGSITLIIGAGIIGSLSLMLLLVLPVQGYIWRINKNPGNDKWEIASESHELWENLVKSLEKQGMHQESPHTLSSGATNHFILWRSIHFRLMVVMKKTHYPFKEFTKPWHN